MQTGGPLPLARGDTAAPQQGRELAGRAADTVPTGLAVTAERDDGVVISASRCSRPVPPSAIHVWIGNIQPLAKGHEKESITCVIPANAPGLSLWSRKPFERYAVSEIDTPLAYRFDESDCVVICDEVKVPWEHIFTIDDSSSPARSISRTPAHTLSNHQACVRYRSKLRLLLGLARRMTEIVRHRHGACGEGRNRSPRRANTA